MPVSASQWRFVAKPMTVQIIIDVKIAMVVATAKVSDDKCVENLWYITVCFAGSGGVARFLPYGIGKFH